jgi:hypothetical protein
MTVLKIFLSLVSTTRSSSSSRAQRLAKPFAASLNPPSFPIAACNGGPRISSSRSGSEFGSPLSTSSRRRGV